MSRSLQLRFRVLLVALLIGAPPLLAEVIILKNGKRLEGTIQSQNRGRVVLQTNAGVQQIPKSAILRIIYSDKKEPKGTVTPTTKNPAKKVPVAKVPVAKEPVAKEPVAKEPVAKEPVAKEPVAKEPAAKEPVAKEPAVGETRVPDPGRPATPGAIWRAAVLPGWGYWYRGETKEAVAAFGLFAVSAGSFRAARQEAALAKSDYAAATRNSLFATWEGLLWDNNARWGAMYYWDSQARGRYRGAVHRHGNRVAWMSGIYLLQLGHVAWISRGRPPDSGLTLSAGPIWDGPDAPGRAWAFEIRSRF